MTRECITHHYACDCREAKFAQIEAENKKLREALEEMLFAYENKDGEFPHQFEIDALAIANEALAGQDKENK